MGFVVLAKGAGKLFMITEFFSDTVSFVSEYNGIYGLGT